MNEKADESQEQAADRPALRDVSPNELKEILEAHRKWVESEGKEGERADLSKANLTEANLYQANLTQAKLIQASLPGANLQGADLTSANLSGAYFTVANLREANLREANLQRADLREANLQGADLREATGLTASQVKIAKNWELALYSDDSLKKLGLKPDHNEQVRKKLAEMEKEKKASGAKP